jgi:flagellar biosynthetic protein FliR
MLAALALFMAMGGLARAVELLVLSYQMIPTGTAPDPATLADWGLARVIRVFALAFSLSAPFVLAALMYNLALGAINRAMPQLMVTFIGAPALTLGGLVLLMLAAPVMLQVWQAAMEGALATPFGAP